ncbi:E2 protein [Eumops bonariensis papillomavirus type 1]|nr:E2 protein [Eumops bonariensis papillomavirus type 1]
MTSQMEKLLQRLDSIQEEILTLYERDSKDLKDHIKLWSLLRRESAIWYILRREGFSTVGGRVVPSIQSSESSAKIAIEIQLSLESLLRSRYGSEKWSLQEISKERYLAEPPRIFKKGGQPVTIMFDDDPQNITEVVSWNYLYIPGDNDTWVKTKGEIDDEGLFYRDSAGAKVYYISFEAEAQNFSETGAVSYRLGSALATIEPVDITDSSSQSRDQNPDPRQQRPTARRAPSSSSSSGRRTRVRGRSSETGEDTARKRRRLQRRSSPPPPSGKQPRPSTGEPQTPVRGGRSGRRSPGDTPESTPKGHRGRSKPLQKETAATQRGYYLVAAKGPVNSLRCLRYRWRKRYETKFMYLSTSFNWTHPHGTERCGSSRFMLAFDNESKRDQFMRSVPVPKNIGLFKAWAEKL